MKGYISVALILMLQQNAVFSQIQKLPFEDNTLENSGKFTVMPYNRLIQSAGKVITYGDSLLENHTFGPLHSSG